MLHHGMMQGRQKCLDLGQGMTNVKAERITDWTRNGHGYSDPKAVSEESETETKEFEN